MPLVLRDRLPNGEADQQREEDDPNVSVAVGGADDAADQELLRLRAWEELSRGDIAAAVEAARREAEWTASSQRAADLLVRHGGTAILAETPEIYGAENLLGCGDMLVLDRGARDGLEPGTVLRVDQRGETIRDVVAEDPRTRVTLPDESAGLIMVFRTFERVSFALVMEAERPMHVLDKVRNP